MMSPSRERKPPLSILYQILTLHTGIGPHTQFSLSILYQILTGREIAMELEHEPLYTFQFSIRFSLI